MPGFSLRVFMPDAEPDGLRVVTRDNYTGVALAARRDQLGDVLKRGDFGRSGVYVLLGPDDGEPHRTRVYVGEGDVVRSRIREHTSKEFWTSLVIFTRSDDTLDKGAIRYLEAELLSIAKNAGRAVLDNSQVPNPPVPTEAVKAELDNLLGEMILPTLRVLGIKEFEPVEKVTQKLSGDADGDEFTYKSGSEIDATGFQTKNGFLVRAGSRVRDQVAPSLGAGYKKLRAELIEDGVITANSEGLIFADDYEFGSPSAAAGVVSGRQTNGRAVWKAADGRTLKAIEDADVETADESDEQGDEHPTG